MMRKNRAKRGYKYLLQILNQEVYLCDWKRGSFNGVSEDVCNGGSDRREFKNQQKLPCKQRRDGQINPIINESLLKVFSRNRVLGEYWGFFKVRIVP